MGYSTDIFAEDLTPFGVHHEIHKAIESRHFPTGDFEPENFRRQLQAMSKGERAFILTWIFFNEIHDGGFEMFFLETGADLAHDTAESFDLVGLPKSAAIIRKAIAAAAIPHPTPEGYDFGEAYTDEISATLDKLDNEYYDSRDDKFEEAVVEYVRQHPEEFA